MATRRRWLQFSLRTAFVLMTALAVWVGVIVNRAREQREAVKAIEALGGAVIYGWQHPAWQNNRSHETLVTSNSTESGFRAWVQRHLGVDPFEEVTEVSFSTSPAMTDSDIVKSIPHLQRAA